MERIPWAKKIEELSQRQVSTPVSELPSSCDLDSRVENGMVHMGAPLVCLGARLEHFPEQLIRTVMAVIDSGRGLYITGKPGRGKTYLAVALLRMIITGIYGKTGKFRSLKYKHENDMLLDIKRAFMPGSDVSEEGMVDLYSSPDVFILDDLGVAKVTDWSVPTIDTIIDRRYRNKRICIITSNLSLEQLATRLDDRISSRIAGMCEVITLEGQDRRMGKK